ncbi:hypothetical protein EMIHUDRAFT_212934 [Emiliania huxleyi CCMP1516]|uniref:FAS1 domain-containing protein n=2 Tax=Emiliania huxleyi TaxID=2903 RepID=A0A0D3IPI8_EMIH1|nr:hypothetical protein EMIHUDRAFT_212934 [Emiliania huxleyi CCMP1516]EOD13173.1 hypothetical protein EMIHUDRAFT_212934 [Emiliania huxleyi CCMP1516]|eukprot:XP_005765602.1 hypothetical protein EMIHUDRAFT_212934 [Emiliania huxleyi CCMP1516]
MVARQREREGTVAPTFGFSFDAGASHTCNYPVKSVNLSIIRGAMAAHDVGLLAPFAPTFGHAVIRALFAKIRDSKVIAGHRREACARGAARLVGEGVGAIACVEDISTCGDVSKPKIFRCSLEGVLLGHVIASEVTSDDLSFGDTAITTLSGRSLIARKEHAGACVSDGEWYNPWQGSHFFCSAFTTQHHCDSFGSMEGHEGRTASQACCTCGGGSYAGAAVTVRDSAGGLLATVTTADVRASNGVIHVIDTAADPALLAQLSDPDSTLTLFAPTDAAFAALGDLTGVLSDRPLLTSLLRKHLLGSVVPAQTALSLSSASVATLAAEDVLVDGSTSSVLVSPTVVGGASTVVTADVQACNGVVHVVDEAPASSFPASSFSLSVGGDARRQRALDSLDIDAVEEAVRSSFANIFGGSAPPSTWRMRLEDRGGREAEGGPTAEEVTAAARDPAFLAGVEAELGVEAQTVASNPPFERHTDAALVAGAAGGAAGALLVVLVMVTFAAVKV